MIFTLETDSCNNPTLVFRDEDEATECFLLLIETFPTHITLFACWGGYFNALTLTNSFRSDDFPMP